MASHREYVKSAQIFISEKMTGNGLALQICKILGGKITGIKPSH